MESFYGAGFWSVCHGYKAVKPGTQGRNLWDCCSGFSIGQIPFQLPNYTWKPQPFFANATQYNTHNKWYYLALSSRQPTHIG